MRKFESGATRDSDDTKLDYEGFLSPLTVTRFAEYMHKHMDTPEGRRTSDNWQKGIPQDAYLKSLFRHFMDVWRLHRAGTTNGDDMEEALCAMWFNVQGYLLESLKQRARRDKVA